MLLLIVQGKFFLVFEQEDPVACDNPMDQRCQGLHPRPQILRPRGGVARHCHHCSLGSR